MTREPLLSTHCPQAEPGVSDWGDWPFSEDAVALTRGIPWVLGWRRSAPSRGHWPRSGVLSGTLGEALGKAREIRSPSSPHQAPQEHLLVGDPLALDPRGTSPSGLQLPDPPRAPSSNLPVPGWSWLVGLPWPPLTLPRVLQDDGPLEPFCSTCLSLVCPHSASLTDTPSAAPAGPPLRTQAGPSLPHPPLPAAHPQPDTCRHHTHTHHTAAHHPPMSHSRPTPNTAITP